MKSKLYRLVVFCLVSVVISSLFACAAPAEETAPFSMEVTDQLGRVVKLEKVPERIISLAPSNTEILFALGLGDKVVAVTDYCNYPPEAEEKPSIGGFSNPDIERVVALSPDLVLATQMHEARIIPALEERGLAVFALSPKTLDEILEAISMVGSLTGTENEAAVLVTQMEQSIKAITDKTSGLTGNERPRVFYLVWHDPLMVAGSGTFQDELITKAGGTNSAQQLTDYAEISLEAVIQANPQVIIAGVGMGTGEDLPLQFVRAEERLRNVDARLNNRIYGADGDIVGRPGPRIVTALEEFAKFIHPEFFKED